MSRASLMDLRGEQRWRMLPHLIPVYTSKVNFPSFTYHGEEFPT